ncbi:MAG: hypothetical protein QHH10_00625 [Peptococcaceae bacterium]|jgi:uncharacterized membrane protein YkvI|nr:hypothetical protein [Peptococcaceae bacterium]MDH7523805.1 hypothetical protein [Peptococcaceae bacterium]
MPDYKRFLSWQVAFTYVGTVIGAGFASGQEIRVFFASFGLKGLLGTVVAGVLFAVLGERILHAAGEKSMENYEQYTIYLFGNRLGKIFNGIIDIFLVCGLSVMLVASSSLCAELLALPEWVGFAGTVLFLYVSLLMDVEGILWLNTLLVPGIIIMSTGIAAASIFYPGQASAQESFRGGLAGGHWLFASILYVSYNLVLGAVILSSLGRKVGKEGSKGTILAGMILGLLAAVICCAFFVQGEYVYRAEIPMLTLAASIHPAAGWSYSLILWTAIFTSALSNGFGLMKRLAGRLSWPRPVLALFIFLPTFAFIGWPLSRVVAFVYPLLGYFGLLFIAAVIIKKK